MFCAPRVLPIATLVNPWVVDVLYMLTSTQLVLRHMWCGPHDAPFGTWKGIQSGRMYPPLPSAHVARAAKSKNFDMNDTFSKWNSNSYFHHTQINKPYNSSHPINASSQKNKTWLEVILWIRLTHTVPLPIILVKRTMFQSTGTNNVVQDYKVYNTIEFPQWAGYTLVRTIDVMEWFPTMG